MKKNILEESKIVGVWTVFCPFVIYFLFLWNMFDKYIQRENKHYQEEKKYRKGNLGGMQRGQKGGREVESQKIYNEQSVKSQERAARERMETKWGHVPHAQVEVCVLPDVH